MSVALKSTDVVIVGAVRTPVGKFRGSLAGVRADHLGAVVLDELITRAGLEPGVVDDVIFGCVTQIGEQSANIARTIFISFTASLVSSFLLCACSSSRSAQPTTKLARLRACMVSSACLGISGRLGISALDES